VRKRDWEVGIEPTREEKEAARERAKQVADDGILDVLNELFGGYETQHNPDELRRHGEERG
jgi:hypothetical protein